jgi:hypothetical protein
LKAAQEEKSKRKEMRERNVSETDQMRYELLVTNHQTLEQNKMLLMRLGAGSGLDADSDR